MGFNLINIKPKGNSLSGIFHEFLKKCSDPISKGYLTLEGPTLHGSLDFLVNASGDWASTFESNYFEIFFNLGFLVPTHYTLSAPKTGWCFQTAWEVYGYNIVERDDPEKWTFLGRNYDNATKTCSDGSLCNGKGISTFTLSNRRKEGFRYIRFAATKSTCGKHLESSGIDFYGSLLGSLTYENHRTCKHELRKGSTIIHYMITLISS